MIKANHRPVQIAIGKSITAYRKELMGIAIIWIMAYHCYTGLLEGKCLVLYEVCNYGNLGVEIFLFLSGIGLYHSLQKDGGVGPFYVRRITRVVIPWLILSCPYWIVKSLIVDKAGFTAFLANWSGISFWMSGINTVWYIAFIIVLYIIYPLIFKFQERSKYAPVVLTWGGVFC